MRYNGPVPRPFTVNHDSLVWKSIMIMTTSEGSASRATAFKLDIKYSLPILISRRNGTYSGIMIKTRSSPIGKYWGVYAFTGGPNNPSEILDFSKFWDFQETSACFLTSVITRVLVVRILTITIVCKQKLECSGVMMEWTFWPPLINRLPWWSTLQPDSNISLRNPVH